MIDHPDSRNVDIAIIGAGAAGLATAIFAARRLPDRTILALDGAKKPGAKILVSGGGRCNVTNVRVTPADFFGGSPNVLKRILAAFSERDAVAWFSELGVPLHEEENGKIFPDSNAARSVLDALLREAAARGVSLVPGHRAINVTSTPDEGFRIDTETNPDAPPSVSTEACPRSASNAPQPPGEHRAVDGSPANAASPTLVRSFVARRVVLATGGRSLPKTGSDGGGYELARRLGHSIHEPTPALVPLVLDGEFHRPLSGIAQEVEILVRVDGSKPRRVGGAMLWTHFGVSGPAILDVSRHWHRAKLDGRPVAIEVNFSPGADAQAIEQRLLNAVARQPSTQLHNVLSLWHPARFCVAILAHLGMNRAVTMAHLPKDARRKLAHALTAFPLSVSDSRGYNFAEVTAGGVPLEEIDPATMQSRRCPGLFLVGEILDVDGRIGGFNFQWAWSTAWCAAAGIAKAVLGTSGPSRP